MNKSVFAKFLKLNQLVERMRHSVWLPVCLKVLGASIGVLSLAMLGKESEGYDRQGALRLVTTADARLESLQDLNRKDLGFQLTGEKNSKKEVLTAASVKKTASQSGSGSGSGSDSGSGSGSASKKPSPCPCSCETKQLVAQTSALLPDGRLVLNLATEKELRGLPGVGPSRAAAILELRKRLKGFKKVTDLLRVRGIGWKSLSKLKPKIVLDRPKKGS